MSTISFDPDSVVYPSGSLIAGERILGQGAEFEVRRPSDGKVVRVERSAGESLVDRAVAAARKAYKTSGWASGEPRDRQRVMRKWAELIDENFTELARLESAVSVRPISAVLYRDVRMAAELIRFYGECIDKVEGSVLATNSGKTSLLVQEPYGVVATISPWNTPLFLATLKIAPAIAAGNAVVLKPSEFTPYSILRLAEYGIEAGLPAGMISIVPGVGAETGAALVRHPDVNYVAFTGSAATGARVMCDAAVTGLKPVSLELGGKSPQLVFADAPSIDVVADIVATSVCANGGQVCFAGTRLVVERSIRDELVDKIEARMASMRPGATWDEKTTLAPTVSEAQARRFEQLVEEAKAGGAVVRTGGHRIEGHPGGIFFAPTIITDAAKDNAAIREELFGPALAVETFESFDEALEMADHAIYGLAAGVHTSDVRKAFVAARAIQAGTVWVNHFGPNTDPNAPMGGYKQSGFGKDFGVMGMQKFFKTKNIAFKH